MHCTKWADNIAATCNFIFFNYLMNKKILLAILAIPAFYFSNAQTKKFDSTLKMGDVGYRVTCYNKKIENNAVTIRPIGFKDYSKPFDIPVIGVFEKALIDDFNDDGFPDLVFYSFDDKDRAQIYAIASVSNKSCSPIYVPDIYIEPTIRNGYEGHDELTSMGGFLIRKFPVYQTDSTTKNTSVIGTRVIEYKAKSNMSNPDNPTFKFEVFKSYDMKQ